MATVKTHDLIHCNPAYESLPSVNNSGIYPYNGSIVRFDDTDLKTYTVKKNVQGRFDNFSIYNVSEKIELIVTSVKFNGQEYLTSPSLYTLESADKLKAAFPNYTVGNYYSYTNNVANLAIVTPFQGVINPGIWMYNYYSFLKPLVEGLGINVNICMTHPESWIIDGWIRFNNITIEKHYDDDFEITFTINTYFSDVLDTTEERKWIFNGETVSELWDGVVPEGLAGPQFSDENSIFSYDFNYDTIEEINECPEVDSFNTSLLNDQSCTNITTNANCNQITFKDNSNYYNSLPGHNYYFFTSRKITMTKPDGSTYIWGTSDIEGVDEVIPPHYESSNSFVYNIGPNDKDGIYEVELCTYPDWNASVFYESFLNTIVRKDGKFYKVLASNTNVDPTSVNGPSYWVEYNCAGDCEKTRYCTKEKIVILCISLLRCYKKLVKEAVCGIESSPCKPLCENKYMMNAMKFKITLDSLEYSVCSEDWDAVSDQIEILNSICCCNG